MTRDSSIPTSTSFVLIGALGMLGRAWRDEFERRGLHALAVDLPEFDLTDPGQTHELVTPEIDVVINCAAYTDVDGAETNEAVAAELNGAAVGRLAERCAEVGATLVHYGTDYVFDGESSEPWRVDAPVSPLNAYGRTKLAGERLARASGADLLLIRTSWLYAPWGKNFVTTILRLAGERDSIRVVNDQRGRPTSAIHLARASLDLWSRGQRGVFHVTDGGSPCTWYEFAMEIVDQSGLSCVVEPCSTAEFPRPARRPRSSVLDLSKTEGVLGPAPPWPSNITPIVSKATASA